MISKKFLWTDIFKNVAHVLDWPLVLDAKFTDDTLQAFNTLKFDPSLRKTPRFW